MDIGITVISERGQLSREQILFALATYDTDYILIHAADVECTQYVLTEAGHIVES